MTALNWPSNLFPQATMFRIDARSLAGGTTITGAEQIAQPTAGIWRAALSSIALNNAARVRAYRALLAGLDGRYGTVLVPVHDKLRAPLSATTYTVIGTATVNPPVEQFWPQVDIEAQKYTTVSSPGTATIVSVTSFNWTGAAIAIGNYVTLLGTRRRVVDVDGTRHTFEPPLSSGPVRTLGTVSATANATASAGATSIQINRATGAAIEAGMYLSVAGKLYMITAITGVAGSVFTCSVRPPLRASITSGTAIEMVNPTCEMRLASDDTGSVSLDHLSRGGSASMEFVEAV